jgi:CYTH domain-containing protein
MKEIEVKYLVDLDKWKILEKPAPELIVQGFLHRSEDLVVRVRTKGGKGFLTIKGKTTGISRTEFEYEIPIAEANQLIEQFTDKYIRKFRYEVVVEGKIWEVDEFKGALEGLVLAELELKAENEEYVKPDWVTKDVSRDPNYYNAVLIEKC